MATTSAEALVAFGEKHVNKGLPKLTQDVFDKGEGSWVTMKSGKKLLDFTCGIGVTNLGTLSCPASKFTVSHASEGHCHPKISKAAADQCMNIVHGQVCFRGTLLWLAVVD